MSSREPSLAEMADSLNVWEAAAIAIERGRPFEINGKIYGRADADKVARQVAQWRVRVNRAAAAAARQLREKWDGLPSGGGRRVLGSGRKVR